MKLKTNRRGASFASGRLKSEIRRHPAILGTLPGCRLKFKTWPSRIITYGGWNPDHPSLHFRRLRGSEDRYSIRVGDYYRAIGRRAGEKVIWVWIGTHSDYDRLAGS
jgi:hypothetical protein